MSFIWHQATEIVNYCTYLCTSWWYCTRWNLLVSLATPLSIDSVACLEPILRSRVTTLALQKLTALLIAWRVFRLKIIFLWYKNSLAYYNAGVIAVNTKIVGLAPGTEKVSILLTRLLQKKRHHFLAIFATSDLLCRRSQKEIIPF
jgi:hypothetical protein